MRRVLCKITLSCLVLALVACSNSEPADNANADPGADTGSHDVAPDATASEPTSLRVATFNASLYRDQQGALIDDLSDQTSVQPAQIAEIVQIKRPDIILINELDYDENGEAAQLFNDNYLAVGQGDQEAIDYPHIAAIPSNTGLPTGLDLNGDGVDDAEVGTEEYAQNAYGFGIFPGQYGFAVFSKYELDTDQMRAFQHFLWNDMPNSLLPDDFYSDEAIEIFRLSSKNHIDLPITIGEHELHILASHPTPPAFDGPEQRNVRRNYDEVRFWHDYIRPDHADYIYDDEGNGGGIDDDAYFVIVGDLNADPHDGDSAESVAALLDNPRLTDPKPASEGGAHSGANRGGENDAHEGEHRHDTSAFHPDVGNLRVDYAIPSSNLVVEDSAVFWPPPDADHADLVTTTDHRLVWVDITLGAEPSD